MPDNKFIFETINCPICGQQISKGGAAYTSHARMHVRKKEALEFKRGKKLLFMSIDAQAKLIEEQPYALLAEEPLPDQPKGVWDITESLNNLSAVDPNAYFITSGEAIKKAEKLVKDAYSLAVKCRSFLNKLKKCRGVRKYLETTRENNRLLVKCKDPKKSSNKYTKET